MPRAELLLTIDEPLLGTFLGRLNRFLAEVRVGERTHQTLIRNTGRLGELRAGTKVLCAPRSGGMTTLLLLGAAVEGGAALIDPPIQTLAFEAAMAKRLLPWLDGWSISKREVSLGGSRIDYMIESPPAKGYVEAKSAARLAEASATFPDCPSERAARHIELLGRLALQGKRCVILFIATHPLCGFFRPDCTADPKVTSALVRAKARNAEVRSIKILLEGRSVRLVNPDLEVVLPARAPSERE